MIENNLTEAGVSVVNIGGILFLHYSRIFLRKEEYEISIPVAIITDVDIEEYQIQDGDLVKLNQDTILEASTARANERRGEFTSQKVQVFVAPHWTLEYSLFKSDSLSEKFQDAVKSIHSGTDFTHFERELARKLLNKGLKKTKFAYQLAQIIDIDNKKDSPEIILS